MRRLGFKARLTLWHGVALALILAAATVVGEMALSRLVTAQVDATLLAVAESEAASALDDGEEHIHLHEVKTSAGGPSLRRFDKLVQIVDMAGHVVDRMGFLGDAALPASPELLARLRRGEMVMQTIPDFAGVPVRVVSLPLDQAGSYRFAIRVATPLDSAFSFLLAGRQLFVGGSVAILVAVTGIGAILAIRALRPIDRLVAKAKQIGESSLQERLPHPGTADEVGRLAATLNEMLDRLEKSFEGQRRFTADASHELRSPLSRLRSELEITLRRPRPAAEYEGVLRSALEEVERLSRITEQLLTLARLDAGEAAEFPVTSVALTPLVEEEIARLKPEADQRQIGIVLEGCPGLAASGAGDALRLVVANLLQNAVKFSPPAGWVTVRLWPDLAQAVFAVSDTGPGIPPEDVSRIFDRFYRRSASRTPDVPGVGLGLAIARAIVAAHGGSIALDSPPGAGATFTVRLPLAPAVPRQS